MPFLEKSFIGTLIESLWVFEDLELLDFICVASEY